jgi:hypothetical protein
MAIPIKSPRTRRLSDVLRALFPEAWRAQRRRRRRYTLAALAAGAAAALVVSASVGVWDGQAGSATPGAVAVRVSSTTLPKAGDYFTLAVVGGRLVVSGGSHGSLFSSDATTDIVRGRPAWSCDAATVDPATLRLGDVVHGNCGDPALYGEHVLAVASLQRVHFGSGLLVRIRIAHVAPGAPEGYTLGPVVATSPQCSDCWPQWIYGDGSLWIYDQYAGPGLTPQNGQLLRISEATGKVAQRWPMPAIDRPLVAVNADGFWLAPSNESGWPAPTPPSQLNRYRSVYHAWPGAHAPTRVLTVGSRGALWLVAQGHTVWLEDGNISTRTQLWKLNGVSATPQLLGAYPARSTQGGEYGEGPPTYAGNAAIGIHYVSNPYNSTADPTTQQIVRLAPDAPTGRTVAMVHARTSQLYAQTAGVALGNSFYFLDPPTMDYPGGNAPPAIHGTGVLYRVQITPAH